MKSSFKLLLNLTFEVMNNLKNVCNSTFNELVNENVTFKRRFIEFWFLNGFKRGYKGFSDQWNLERECIELELVIARLSNTK